MELTYEQAIEKASNVFNTFIAKKIKYNCKSEQIELATIMALTGLIFEIFDEDLNKIEADIKKQADLLKQIEQN